MLITFVSYVMLVINTFLPEVDWDGSSILISLPDCNCYIYNSLHSWTRAVPVDVDGLGGGAPHSETLLNDLLDFREVRLQGLVAEHFGKNLERRRNKQMTSNSECSLLLV